MTPLSETERNELNQFVRTRLYERLKFHVLKNLRINVLGSNRSADQTALDLALKEGVSVAFDEIEAYAEPDATHLSPIQPRQIDKRNTLTNE
tara:strand:+ start:6786 stop:7061 length:276 start_codon:yes stop_codon:yes gene_type:complete